VWKHHDRPGHRKPGQGRARLAADPQCWTDLEEEREGTQYVMTVTFTTSVSEQVGAVRAILWRAASNWLMFALFVLLPLVFLSVSERRPGDSPSQLTLVGVAAGGAVFWWLFPWYMVWIMRRGLSHPNGPYDVFLDDAKVRIQNPVGVLELKWAAIRRARETAAFLLLYFGKTQAQFIPKRVLAPPQLEELRALVAQQLGERAELGRTA
jgi:hypothetical protein